MILQPELDCGDPYHKKRCDFRRLIFAPDGRVYSCDQWMNDEQTSLGDIQTDSLTTILNRKHQLWAAMKHFLRKSGNAMACGACEWGHQCGGGCLTCMKYNALLQHARAKGRDEKLWFEETLSDRWSNHNGETYYCDGLRAFRNHVRNVVKQEMADGR